jgi:hypothetical protein
MGVGALLLLPVDERRREDFPPEVATSAPDLSEPAVA